MSYGPLEISRDSSSPVELYDIALGAEAWHFTSAEDPVTIDGTDYMPIAINRESVPLASEERTEELAVTLPSDHEFVQKYVNVVPGDIATITIRRFQRYDDDTEVISLFKGVVSAVAFTNNGSVAQIGIAPFTDNLSKPMPRYVYSGLCNNILGDQWCTIDLETGEDVDSRPFKFVGNCSDVDYTTITVDGVGAAYPDNFFQAGVLKTAAGDQRLIVKQVGDTLYLYIPLFEGVALEGNDVTLYAGCDHSLTVCQNKFDNVINYGGFPFVPRNNPFETGLV